jgi:hypothetical protein
MWSVITKEMFSRLPVNLPFSLKKLPSVGWDDDNSIELICLKSCNTIFETITHHLRGMRPLNEFQSIWLSFISVLAMNISVILDTKQSKKRPMLNEYIEMLVALLRFLVPDTKCTPIKPVAAGSGHTTAQLVVLPRSGAGGSSQVWCTPPQKSSSRLTAFTDAFASIKEDVMLLSLTWKSVVGVCPAIANILQQSHPYMAEILSREPSDYVYPEEIPPPAPSAGAPSNQHALPVRTAKNTSSMGPRQTAEDVATPAPSAPAAVRQETRNVRESPAGTDPRLTLGQTNASTPSLVSPAPALPTEPAALASADVATTSTESQESPEFCIDKEKRNSVPIADTDLDLRHADLDVTETPPVLPSSALAILAATSEPCMPGRPAQMSASPRRADDGIRQIGTRTFMV